MKRNNIIVGISGALLLLLGLIQMYFKYFSNISAFSTAINFYAAWFSFLFGMSLLTIYLCQLHEVRKTTLTSILFTALFILSAFFIFIFINITVVLRIAP